MPLVLLVLFLGLITYWVISRSFTNITNTPVWMLWLVMMTPVLVLSLWIIFNGDEPPPPVLSYGLLVLCPLLYAILILVGATSARRSRNRFGDRTNQSGKADSQREAGLSQAAMKSDKGGQASAAKKKADKKAEQTRPITRDEETLLQRCFPWSMYYLQNIEYRPQAMICKGKLKAPAQEAYQVVKTNVERDFGDRFLVLLQEGLNGRPFFALVPNPYSKSPTGPMAAALTRAQGARVRKLKNAPITRPGLALMLALTTLITTTLMGVSFISGISDPELIQQDPTLLHEGLAYAVSLMVILGVHEGGHYLATRYHKLKATLPYFIPVPFFLGTFGAFIQMRSPMPNRRALFDVAVAGPLAGLVVSVPILLWGLAHSTVIPLEVPVGETSQLLTFEALDPGRSILLLVISKLALGSVLQPDSALQLHPVAVSGCLGLIVTALNLMPVGQLDGGHIVHAMYGQRTAAIVSQVARFLMLLISFVYQEFFLWAILLLFIPAAEPALNDVSELDGRRDALGLLSLTLLVLIILPAPAALMRLLF